MILQHGMGDAATPNVTSLLLGAPTVQQAQQSSIVPWLVAFGLGYLAITAIMAAQDKWRARGSHAD